MSTITNQVLERLNAAPVEERKRTGELGQEDFLELMLAQVRNQDPFEPMQNGEFIAQMAQFSMVDGIQEMQQSIATLSTAMASSQALTASTLVGRSVLAPGSDFVLDTEGGVSGVLDTQGAAAVTLTVHDASGALVAQRALMPSPDGYTRFSFDGVGNDGTRLAPGRYRLQAQALVDGSTVAVQASLARRIESVTLGNGLEDLTLNLESGAAVPFNSVREFL